MLRYYFALLLLGLPVTASAAVTITEVAWMGSTDSANHEWIELYNSGPAVDVSGWTLRDQGSLEISMSGTISAASYAVLERTSEASAPGAAFVVYTGALSNSGATLVLRDSVGTIIDQVVGSSNWSAIGGDNTTKDTAQLTATGWVTAAPTPGAGAFTATESPTASAPVDTTTSEADTTSDTSVNETSTGSASDSVSLVLPDITLELEIIGPTHAHVNQPVTFTAVPSGIGDTLLDSLQYVWNWGDSHTASGESATHVYQYPGRYAVVLDAGYKRQQRVVRQEIVVLPVTLSLAVTDEVITITNETDEEVDLGGYRLVGKDVMRFAPHTVVLPGAVLTIPRDQLVAAQESVMLTLYDQAGSVIAKQHSGGSVVAIAATPRISALATSRVIDQSPGLAQITSSPRFTFAGVDAPVAPVETELAAEAAPERSLTPTAAAQEPQVAAVAAGQAGLPAQWPFYVLLLVLGVGVLALYVLPASEPGKDSQ